MTEDSTKHHWLKIAAIALMTFIIAFLAFYLALEIMFNRISDPMYSVKKIEKILEQEQKNIRQFGSTIDENPFIPKMRPMLVNLVKEENKYQIIVDLKPLDGNEQGIDVAIKGDEVTISGQMDKKVRGTEKIINFTQTYYLDEELQSDMITKEKRGDKYIITIPFKD